MLDFLICIKHLLLEETEPLKRYIQEYGEDHFLQKCDIHQLSSVLYSFAASPNLDWLSIEGLYHLKSIHLAQWRQSAMLWRSLIQIKLLLSGATIPAICLKGAYLAHRFYGDIHGRPYSDIDLLVPESMFRSARDILLDAGFVAERSSPQHPVYLNNIHHLELSKGDIHIDLHHNLRVNRYIQINLDTIWQQKAQYEVEGQQLVVLPDEYCLVTQLLTLHNDIAIGTLHGRVMLDAYLVLRETYPTMNWDQFMGNRHEDKTFKICLNMLNILLYCFDCSEDFPIITEQIKQNQSIIQAPQRWLPLLFEPLENRFFQRKWFALSMYNTSTILAFIWWLLTLPVRYLFYANNFAKRRFGHGLA